MIPKYAAVAIFLTSAFLLIGHMAADATSTEPKLEMASADLSDSAEVNSDSDSVGIVIMVPNDTVQKNLQLFINTTKLEIGDGHVSFEVVVADKSNEVGSEIDVVIDSPQAIEKLSDSGLSMLPAGVSSDESIEWLGSAAWYPSICSNTVELNRLKVDLPSDYNAGAVDGGAYIENANTQERSWGDANPESTPCELVAEGSKALAYSSGFDAATQRAAGKPVSFVSEKSNKYLVPAVIRNAGQTSKSQIIVKLWNENPELWSLTNQGFKSQVQ